jgi:UPF0271 protein
MPNARIDLNSDVGESFGNYTIGMDEEVIPLISSANIACGFHAGDPTVMRRTIKLAAKHGIAIGAHPGLPDLLGFGRRAMDVSLGAIKDYVAYQIGAIAAFAKAENVPLQHVKTHGALYNMAVARPEIWDAVAEVIAAIDNKLILFVLGGSDRSPLQKIGLRHGVRIAFEFFADRAYNPDGTLVSRREPGAVIHDHEVAAKRVLRMATEGMVTCIDGSTLSLSGETVCVHGDNPTALKLVQKIRQTLEEADVAICPPGSFL